MQVNKQIAADRAQSNVIKMYGIALEDFYKTGNLLSLAHMHNVYKSLHRHIQTRSLARRLGSIAWDQFGIHLTRDVYQVSRDKQKGLSVQRQLDYIEVLKAGILELK